MGIFSRSTLYQYFLTRKTPTQQQYANVIDSNFNLLEDTLPIAKVDGLTNTINDIYLRLNTNASGDPVSNSESFVVDGNFPKTFSAGKTLDSILIDPPASGTYFVNIGTTAGGTEIEEQFSVDGDEPDAFVYAKKFKVDTTWYFSNVPASSNVTIYYKS